VTRIDDKYLKPLRKRYRKASRKECGAILDEFEKTTGSHRKYAIRVLRGKRRQEKRPARRPRRALYGQEEAQALLLWELFDGICSKRQRAATNVELPRLCFGGKLHLSGRSYDKLMTISPATIDRLLRGRKPRLVKAWAL